MYIFINSTNAEVWHNATILRKSVDLLENATTASNSLTGERWNFTSIQDVASFMNKSSGELQKVSSIRLEFCIEGIAVG